jgi:hypothetical protein
MSSTSTPVWLTQPQPRGNCPVPGYSPFGEQTHWGSLAGEVQLGLPAFQQPGLPTGYCMLLCPLHTHTSPVVAGEQRSSHSFFEHSSEGCREGADRVEQTRRTEKDATDGDGRSSRRSGDGVRLSHAACGRGQLGRPEGSVYAGLHRGTAESNCHAGTSRTHTPDLTARWRRLQHHPVAMGRGEAERSHGGRWRRWWRRWRP